MYLHEDKGLFFDVVNAASEKLNIPMAVIEKDYYVTMILKLLSSKSENCVFKGGSSGRLCGRKLVSGSKTGDSIRFLLISDRAKGSYKLCV